MIPCIICGEACYDPSGSPIGKVLAFQNSGGQMLSKTAIDKNVPLRQVHAGCLEALVNWTFT